MAVFFKQSNGSDYEYRIKYYSNITECNFCKKGPPSELINIEGHYSISVFQVKENAIVFSRKKDFHTFNLLEKKSDKWEITYKGIKNDYELFYPFDLRFLNYPNNSIDHSILQVSLKYAFLKQHGLSL